MLTHWNDVLPRLLVAATSSEGQFDSVVTETMAFFSTDPDRARLLMREVLDRPAEMGALIQQHVRQWVAIVCDYIRKGQHQGRVHADIDPQAYVFSIINLVLSNVATYECLGAMATSPEHRDKMFRAHMREVLRIAKASLFRSTKQE
jgi:hypothetical protein